jgi:hypothetical protein
MLTRLNPLKNLEYPLRITCIIQQHNIIVVCTAGHRIKDLDATAPR